MEIGNDTLVNLTFRKCKISLDCEDNFDLKLHQRGPTLSVDISENAPGFHSDFEECKESGSFRSNDREPRSASDISSDWFDESGIQKSTVSSCQDEIGHQFSTKCFDYQRENTLATASTPVKKTKEECDVINRSMTDLSVLTFKQCWMFIQWYIRLFHSYTRRRLAVIQEGNDFERLPSLDRNVPSLFEGEFSVDTDDCLMPEQQMQRNIQHAQKDENIKVFGKAFGKLNRKGILHGIVQPSIAFMKHYGNLPIKADNEVHIQNSRAINNTAEDVEEWLSDSSVSLIDGLSLSSTRAFSQQLEREVREKSCLYVHSVSDIKALESKLVTYDNLTDGEEHTHQWGDQYEVKEDTLEIQELPSPAAIVDFVMLCILTLANQVTTECTNKQVMTGTTDSHEATLTNRGVSDMETAAVDSLDKQCFMDANYVNAYPVFDSTVLHRQASTESGESLGPSLQTEDGLGNRPVILPIVLPTVAATAKKRGLENQHQNLAPALPDIGQEPIFLMTDKVTTVSNECAPNQVLSKAKEGTVDVPIAQPYIKKAESDISLTNKVEIVKQKTMNTVQGSENRECGSNTEETMPQCKSSSTMAHENEMTGAILSTQASPQDISSDKAKKPISLENRVAKASMEMSDINTPFAGRQAYSDNLTGTDGSVHNQTLNKVDELKTGNVPSLVDTVSQATQTDPSFSRQIVDEAGQSYSQTTAQSTNVYSHLTAKGTATISTSNSLQCQNIKIEKETPKRDPAFFGATVTKLFQHINPRPHRKKKSPSTLRRDRQRLHQWWRKFWQLEHSKQTKEEKRKWLSPKGRHTFVHDHISTRSIRTTCHLSMDVVSPLSPNTPTKGKDIEAVKQTRVDTSLHQAFLLDIRNAQQHNVHQIDEKSSLATSLPGSGLCYHSFSEAKADLTAGYRVSSCPNLTSFTAQHSYTEGVEEAGETAAPKRKHPLSSDETVVIKSDLRNHMTRESHATSINTTSDDPLTLDPGGRKEEHSSDKHGDTNKTVCTKSKIMQVSVTATFVPCPPLKAQPTEIVQEQKSHSNNALTENQEAPTTIAKECATGNGMTSAAVEGQLQSPPDTLNTAHTTVSRTISASPPIDDATIKANITTEDLKISGDLNRGHMNSNQTTQNVPSTNSGTKNEGRGALSGGNVESCSCCVGDLLKYAGCVTGNIKVKEEIIYEMGIGRSRLPRKTVHGLALWCLREMDQWEIEKLIGYTFNPCVPHETAVHNVLRELKYQGLKMGHVVEYFSREDSKRSDILQLIAKIHPDCSYCCTQITVDPDEN